jgi:hypothetical protein
MVAGLLGGAAVGSLVIVTEFLSNLSKERRFCLSCRNLLEGSSSNLSTLTAGGGGLTGYAGGWVVCGPE